mgnify:CR=1 FL=1
MISDFLTVRILHECHAGHVGSTPRLSRQVAESMVKSGQAEICQEQGKKCARCGGNCSGALRMVGWKGRSAGAAFRREAGATGRKTRPQTTTAAGGMLQGG